MWLPFMILPIQAAVERIPGSYIEASGDLGAGPALTFRQRDPAAGAAGHRGRLDLHLLADAGRLHHPAGHRRQHAYIGQVVYKQQGVAGNVPFAAAFSLVPIVVIGVYLWFAKRWGPSMRSEPRAWG